MSNNLRTPHKYKGFLEKKFICMTRPIVIQVEQFFPKEYSAVCGEHKGNFNVCLNHQSPQYNINYLST